MSDKTRTNPKPQYGAQAGKRGLLLRFTIFMAWVAGIGLLLSLVACTPVDAKQIASDGNSRYHSLTTKLLAVKPSRHSLAIFVPKIYGATNPIIATGAKRHIYSLLPIQNGSNASYGGLIRPNTIAFMVNKSSRLVTVVETRPPHPVGIY